MKLRFIAECEVDVVDKYGDYLAGKIIRIHKRKFQPGETVSCTIMRDDGGTWNLRFEDGSGWLAADKKCFEIVGEG